MVGYPERVLPALISHWAEDSLRTLAIDHDSIREMLVPLAPLFEQQVTVRRTESLYALADRIQRRLDAATQRADALTQAILARAFRGELVETEAQLARREGRDYEPASELLTRLPSQHDSTVQVKRRKRPPSHKGKG